MSFICYLVNILIGCWFIFNASLHIDSGEYAKAILWGLSAITVTITNVGFDICRAIEGKK